MLLRRAQGEPPTTRTKSTKIIIPHFVDIMMTRSSSNTSPQKDDTDSAIEAHASTVDCAAVGGGGDLMDKKKKFKRVMANRRSAKASRERRKKLYSELQTTIGDLLLPTNRFLREENYCLRDELEEVKQ
jgi:hypothetical protein